MSKMSNGLKVGLGLLAAAAAVGVTAVVMSKDDEEKSNGDGSNCTEAGDRKTHRNIQYTVDACRGADGKLTYYGVILLPMQPRTRLEQGRADVPAAEADAKAWIDSKLGGAVPPNNHQQAMTVCQHMTTLLINYMAELGKPLTEDDKQKMVTSCMAMSADPRFAAMVPCILAAKTWPEAVQCQLQMQQQPITTTFAGMR